jgi:Na+-transporting NADH:ubiquinone oxidoreductase subunit C
MSEPLTETRVSNDTALRALGVAFAVALVCALLVSTVAVGLRPLQQANIEAERIAQLELVLAALADIGAAQTIDDLEAQIIDLDSGRELTGTASTANQSSSQSSANSGIDIPADADLAGIKRRPPMAQIYLIRDTSGDIDMIILPVWGRGYQSTLRAWLVLSGDTRLVRALKFYEHGETPGIGARIQEPAWEALWQEAPLYDETGILRLGVRSHSAGRSDSNYLIDGISGATRTSQGVDALLRFWLGDYGYGPFLKRLREEQT